MAHLAIARRLRRSLRRRSTDCAHFRRLPLFHNKRAHVVNRDQCAIVCLSARCPLQPRRRRARFVSSSFSLSLSHSLARALYCVLMCELMCVCVCVCAQISFVYSLGVFAVFSFASCASTVPAYTAALKRPAAFLPLFSLTSRPVLHTLFAPVTETQSSFPFSFCPSFSPRQEKKKAFLSSALVVPSLCLTHCRAVSVSRPPL